MEEVQHRLTVSMKEGILEIVVSGVISEQLVQKLHHEVMTEIRKNKPKAVICDISILTGRFDDVVRAFVRTRSIPEDVGNMPLAVVDPSSDAAFKTFYENTAFNAGQTLKWFDDMESARSWIKSRMK